MATTDVPGANPKNRDELAAGCWAEHQDGSLILVNGLRGSEVVFEIFDPAGEPGQSFRNTMAADQFKRDFSWPRTTDKWTWHDKTEFPWDRVENRGIRSQSAAARLIQQYGLNSVPQPASTKGKFTVKNIIGRIQTAINSAPSGSGSGSGSGS